MNDDAKAPRMKYFIDASLEASACVKSPARTQSDSDTSLGAWQEVEEQHERAGPEHEQRGQEGPQQDRGRDEIDHWSGGREAGAVGGWPETRRDPAAFRMPLFIPSGSASPARPWVDRERCAGRSPSPAPER